MTAASEDLTTRCGFTAQTERYRRELVAYCYRMVGSAHEADDLVQETYLRAWRSASGFEARASIRAWLYAITTNLCLTALQRRRRRVLPSGLAGPYDGPDRAPTDVPPEPVSWLEPLPDAWIAPAASDPAQIAIGRESVRLALIVSLQQLPARQRAIFILREVVGFSALETAEVLGTTLAAVKSGLQRARARIDGLALESTQVLEPTDRRSLQLLEGSIAAFERSDASLLVEVLRADATLEATPFIDWQAGRLRCIRMLEVNILGNSGDWRMLATSANGQPAAAVYRRQSDGSFLATGIVVLTPTGAGVSRVVAFHHDPSLVGLFGFASKLSQ